MDSSPLVLDLDSFTAALQYLELEKGVKLGQVQNTFIALCRQCPVSKRMVIMPNKEDKAIRDAESGTQVLVTYPPRNGRLYAIAVLFAVVSVSQPDRDCTVFLASKAMAEEFIQIVCKILDLFEEAEEFGWCLSKIDLRRSIEITTKKYACNNRITAYAKPHRDTKGIKANCFCIELAD